MAVQSLVRFEGANTKFMVLAGWCRLPELEDSLEPLEKDYKDGVFSVIRRRPRNIKLFYEDGP